jgi:FkbM family methyltransferase
MSKAGMIRWAGNLPVVSGLLRWLASLYAEGSVVTIRSGHARGLRWRRSHRYVNGYWLGHYELDVQAAIVGELRPGDGFLDLGANAGFFSLVAVKAAGPGGWCVSVDPDPDNCAAIQSLIELNGFPNWRVLQQAVAESEGLLSFVRSAAGSPTGHLGDGREAGERLEVKATTVDAVCERFGRPRFVKVDVEGAEARVLQGARRAVAEVRPTWLIELHGPEPAAKVWDILTGAGYNFFTLHGQKIAGASSLPNHVLARPS